MTANTATARYEWHPAANLFPLLSGEELDALVADIRAEGLHNPIVLHEGLVLDGRNRLLACEKAGVEPRFIEWDSKGSSPTAWVISLNLQRRHLDAGQRASVAVEAKPLLEGEAKERQREHGGTAPGVGRSTVLKNEKRVHVDKAVAEQFNVSSGYVHAAQKIKDASPEAFERVKAGSLSISEAQRQLGTKQAVKATEEPRPESDAAIWIDYLCQQCRERLFPKSIEASPAQTPVELNVAEKDVLPNGLTYEPAGDYEPGVLYEEAQDEARKEPSDVEPMPDPVPGAEWVLVDGKWFLEGVL